MKVIIAGSRTFTNSPELFKFCDLILSSHDEIEVVSGGASGPDKFGEMWAERSEHKVTVMPAEWNKHGKSAGPIRNQEMAEYADALIAFWDGESRGTKNMIEEARKKKLSPIIVYIY